MLFINIDLSKDLYGLINIDAFIKPTCVNINAFYKVDLCKDHKHRLIFRRIKF